MSTVSWPTLPLRSSVGESDDLRRTPASEQLSGRVTTIADRRLIAPPVEVSELLISAPPARCLQRDQLRSSSSKPFAFPWARIKLRLANVDEPTSSLPWLESVALRGAANR